MEFELQYNEIVLRNKNFFYFIHYCQESREFEIWLEDNEINFEQYNQLDEHFKEIYNNKKMNDIICVIKIYKNNMIKVKQYPYEQRHEQRRNILKDMYKYFLDNEYFIHTMKDKSYEINEILNFFNTNISIFRRIGLNIY